MSASSGRLRRMTDYFSLIAQVAATLLVAYVVLVGPRRNADRFARVLEVLSAVLMAYVLVTAMALALPRFDQSRDSEFAGYLYLLVLMSVLMMVFAAFVRPDKADRPFWFRPLEPAKSSAEPQPRRPAARPVRSHLGPSSKDRRSSRRRWQDPEPNRR